MLGHCIIKNMSNTESVGQRHHGVQIFFLPTTCLIIRKAGCDSKLFVSYLNINIYVEQDIYIYNSRIALKVDDLLDSEITF